MEIAKEEENTQETTVAQQDGDVTPAEEAKPQQEGDEEAKQEQSTETSRHTLSIEVISFSDNRQDINVTTPKGSSLSDNVGTLEIAKTILLRKL